MFSPLGICYYYNDQLPVLLKYQASLPLFLNHDPEAGEYQATKKQERASISTYALFI